MFATPIPQKDLGYEGLKAVLAYRQILSSVSLPALQAFAKVIYNAEARAMGEYARVEKTDMYLIIGPTPVMNAHNKERRQAAATIKSTESRILITPNGRVITSDQGSFSEICKLADQGKIAMCYEPVDKESFERFVAAADEINAEIRQRGGWATEHLM